MNSGGGDGATMPFPFGERDKTRLCAEVQRVVCKIIIKKRKEKKEERKEGENGQRKRGQGSR